MRIRRLTVLLGLAFTALIVLWLWHGQKKPTESLLTASVETNVAASSETPIRNSSASAPLQTNLPSANAATGAAASKLLPPNKSKQTIGVLAMYNDVPIDFYGKVEDQFSNAVANAAVRFSVRVYNGVRSGVDRGQLSSDANGLFTISGYKGERA